MKRKFDRILSEAMTLPPDDRSALGAALIESLDERVDPDAEVAWAIEIARRLRELDEGKTRLIPWPEVHRRIFGRAPRGSRGSPKRSRSQRS